MFILERLVSAAAPHRCLACGTEGSLVCAYCLDKLRVPRREACFACNRLTPGGRTCINCYRRHPVRGVTVASYYDDAIRKYIMAVKYESAGSQAALAAALLAPMLRREYYDVVTWVPSSPARLRVRGYNQAQILARALARHMNLPYEGLLERQGSSSQVGRSRTSRLAEIKGQYAQKGKGVQGARILLIDDVITTGATMGECARQLKLAGAKSVWGAAIAKH